MKKNKPKPKTEAVFYMKASQIEAMVEDEIKKRKDNWFEEMFNAFFNIALSVLKDKYGFGKKRLGDFTEALTERLKDMQDGYFTAEEMEQQIYEETGIKFKRTY